MVILLAFAAFTPILAQDSQKDRTSPETLSRGNLRTFVPTTVSKGWRDVYAKLPDPTQAPPMPGPDDIEAWGKVHRASEEAAEADVQQIIQRYTIRVQRRDFGGVPVLEVTPKGWKDNGKVLVYVHGGAYTLFTARSTLRSSGPVAAHTGLRVIAVDYTNPPRAKWQEVTSQVVTVFQELMKQGLTMKDIAVYGDSAGGGLAAGSVLKLRDAGMGMPAAVVLWSPWADITETGDTYQTLKDAEPNFLYENVLGPSADAYADRKDQKHPYVSPVYGDFGKGFPPTLIQGGTREIFLSNFVRLYRALDTAEQTVTLDIYEGMPHVFQAKLPASPESVTALKKMDAFLVKHLKKRRIEMGEITPPEAKRIAEEAYIFAFSMLENYKTMYAQAVNENLPTFKAPFNQFNHWRQLLGPEFTEIVAPNNDTLYSMAWLDLGTEPIVLSLPDFPDERYYVIQIVDMYAFNVEYIGARATGYQAGRYLFAGPGWDGPTPEGIDGVRRTEGRFIFLLGRTAAAGAEDVPAVNALQDQFTLTPLSAYLGQPAPEPAPTPAFPTYDPEKATSIGFIDYFNFLLGQLEPGPDERPLLEEWAKIGVQAGKTFDPDTLAPEVREAVAGGVAAAHEKIKAESLKVGRNVNNWTLIGEGFGYRSMVGGKDLMRAAANMLGLYGNNPEEAYNFTAAKDSDGEPLDASKHNYVIHFETPPPVKAFWSVTMYKLPAMLLVANPIKRYSIGDRTPGFTPEEDGSVTIYLQHESPGPDKESNWLPAPDGPFLLALRIYWPEQDILDGKWEPSPIEKAMASRIGSTSEGGENGGGPKTNN